VQTPHYTLATGAGSCRDMAALFIEAARHLGFAARYVAGYLRTDASSAGFGATHAWAEAYLPERGWTAFDPTGEAAVGPDHIAVNVARDPGTVPPVSGSFTGIARASLEIGVWVTRLADDAAA
jgi:transglutaminase-like putative cysteine protease